MINNIKDKFYRDDTNICFVERLYDATSATIFFTGGGKRFEIEAVLDTESDTFKFDTKDYLSDGTFSVYVKYKSSTVSKTEFVKDVEVEKSIMDSTRVEKTSNEKILEQINLRINNRFLSDYDSLTIAGRSIAKMPLDVLLLMKQKYEGIVADENNDGTKQNKIIIEWTGKR